MGRMVHGGKWRHAAARQQFQATMYAEVAMARIRQCLGGFRQCMSRFRQYVRGFRQYVRGFRQCVSTQEHRRTRRR